MRVLYIADFALFLLFLYTLLLATSSDEGFEVVGLLAFLFWGLPALVLLSLNLND
jgi:hypothetical protein